MASTTNSKKTYLHDPHVQLMMHCQNGDDNAFAQLVDLYQDRLIGFFFHLFQDKETAEDSAQEVFLRVYRARARYTPNAKFSTWLYQIAHNLAKNMYRGSNRRKEVPLNVRESGPLGTRPEEKVIAEKSALMPSRLFDKREIQEHVQQALNNLGKRQKLAVVLHRFEGMSYADIAATMDLSVSAVKSLLSRARENLRIQLEQYVNQ